MSLTNATPLDAAVAAKSASHILAALPTSARNDALTAIHSALLASKSAILAANAADLDAARAAASTSEALSPALVSRLDLGRKGKFDDMLKGVLDVRDLPDPVGKVTLRTRLDDGLDLERVTAPIGVLLVIFEARPEVIANIAALAIKSGNAAILKGGRESTNSFVAISQAISGALATLYEAATDKEAAVPPAAIQLVTTRDVIPQLLALDAHIDLVIPRGGNELVRYVKQNTRVPVLGHADGLCSIYIAPDADVEMAVKVVVDSKTSYPAACNSVETLLVHRDALGQFKHIAMALAVKGVVMRCDAESKEAAQAGATESGADLGDGNPCLVEDAQPVDYDTEHLALVLSVKVVSSLAEAVAHINKHGSHHTDAIVTASKADAERFMSTVDSAGVYHNASTRFADGMRYGFGTEVGISTNKIHSRGPVGLEGLTIYKYKIRGGGHMSAEYGEGEGQKRYKHESLSF